MSEPIGALRAELSAGHAKFAADMGKAKRAVQTNATGMQTAMARVGKSFNNTMKSVFGFRGAMVAMAAIGGFGLFMKKTIDTADQLSKMAQKVGLTTESLSTLKYAASISGVELEKLQTGLVRLSRNSLDVTLGLQTAREGFDSLGVSVTGSDGSLKKSDVLLKEIANKFKNMADGAAKTAIATKLFGRAGAELIPMLNLGAAGIEELEQKARDLGIELSTATGRAAEQFNDDIQELTTHAKGLGMSLAEKLLPKLTAITKAMKDAADEGGLLKAVWVGLGGLGAALFTDELDTLPQKIKKARTHLEKLREEQENKPLIRLYSDEKLRQQIAKASTELYKLEMQQRNAEAAAEAKRKKEAEEAQGKEKELIKAEQAAKKAEEAEKRKLAIQSDGAKLTAATQTAEEKYAAQIARIDALLKAKVITQEVANRALAQATEELEKNNGVLDERMKKEEQRIDLLNELAQFEDAHKKAILSDTDYEIYKLDELYKYYSKYIQDKVKLDEWYVAEKAKILKQDTKEESKEFDELKQTIEGWGKESSDALVEFALTGKQSFSEMIQSMIKDLLKMMVYQNIMKPLFGALSSGISGGGIWGAVSSLFSGKAVGGAVGANRTYEVNERGIPEILSIGNRQFLTMANQGGKVTPMNEAPGGGLTISVPVTVAERNPMMQSELRKEIEFTVERVMRRHS